MTMLRAGVLQVVRAPTRPRQPVVDVSPAFRFTTRKAKWLPGYLQICYGLIRATRILRIQDHHDGTSTVDFRYEGSLSPWGQALMPYLHLQTSGEAEVNVGQSSEGALMVAPPFYLVNFQRVRYPPNGANWYPADRFPHGIPGALTPRGIKV
jgi:hypothetical protein